MMLQVLKILWYILLKSIIPLKKRSFEDLLTFHVNFLLYFAH